MSELPPVSIKGVSPPGTGHRSGTRLTRFPCGERDLEDLLSTGLHRPEKLSTGCAKDLWMSQVIIPNRLRRPKADRRIPKPNHPQAHFRVEMGRPKGLPQGNGWTKGDRRGCGRTCPLYGDLSTESRSVVDLSPGRDGSLWITPVDNVNQQVGPAETSPQPTRHVPSACPEPRRSRPQPGLRTARPGSAPPTRTPIRTRRPRSPSAEPVHPPAAHRRADTSRGSAPGGRSA